MVRRGGVVVGWDDRYRSICLDAHNVISSNKS
jgi:hypothetical protein